MPQPLTCETSSRSRFNVHRDVTSEASGWSKDNGARYQTFQVQNQLPEEKGHTCFMIIPQLQSISLICNGPESVTGIRLTSKCVTQGYFLLSHTNRPPPPPCAIKQQPPLGDDTPETSRQHPSILARLFFFVVFFITASHHCTSSTCRGNDLSVWRGDK